MNEDTPPRALAPEPSMRLHHWTDESEAATREAKRAEAVGQAELAAERYIEAASHSCKGGDYDRAVALVERALRLLDNATPAASHRSLRIAALMTLGRIKFAASDDDQYTLPSALAALESAGSLLLAADHVELRAELAQLTAQVYYAIGGEKQLGCALALLVGARHELRDAGLPMEAARLLNDEAAVRLKRGELVLARQLLQRSRKTFARFVASSPIARRELARSAHILARLALHARTRDREELELALQHARSAEHGYKLVGDKRERIRAVETQSRLRERIDSASR